MGKNKGITLIALVVTIIVLLILAGVSILMLTGENSNLSKARWAEFVNEYGNLDEVKNVFALEQQTIENYDIKINKNFKLKSLFTNKSYAVDVNGIKTYYPVKGSRVNPKEKTETLQRTIKYEENLKDEDLELSSDKVQLYEVDIDLLPSINGVKRKYVINIISGKLYSINQVHYDGLIYHTPRYGIKREESDEPLEDEKKLTIHYLSGYEGGDEKYIQIVDKDQASSVTLIENKFIRENYEFIHWKEVPPNDEKNEEIDVEKDNKFEKRTDGYYGVVNELSEILEDDTWEEEILYYIRGMEETEESRQQTINRIIGYLIEGDTAETDINIILSKTEISEASITNLAEWFLSGQEIIDYLTNLQAYEEGRLEDTDAEPEINEQNETYYNNEQTNINMEGKEEVWLKAEWLDTTKSAKVTLVANGNGAKVSGQDEYQIVVEIGQEYGESLIEAQRQGYVFKGWWTDPIEESNESIRINSYDIYDANKLTNNKLYAHWIEEGNPNIATIIFDAKVGGIIKETNTQTKTIKKVISDTLGELPIVEVEGVRFATSWYTEPTGGTKVTKKTEIEGNMTLYCQWNKVELAYPNGGTLGNKYKDGTVDKTVNYPQWNPVRNNAVYVADGQKIGKQNDYPKKGYSQLPREKESNFNRYIYKEIDGFYKNVKPKFLGWYTAPDGVGTKIKYNSYWKNEYVTETPQRLYAFWKYVITYDANGGYWNKKINNEKIQVEKEPMQATKSAKYPSVEKPKKDKYTFVGWYTQPQGGRKVELRNGADRVTEDNQTLYAHWEEIVFEVQVDKNTISNTGWTQNAVATSGSLSGYTVTYYIENAKNSPLPMEKYAETQTSKNVSEKKDLTTYYVWAKASKDGVEIPSRNYVVVYTGHSHNGNEEEYGGCYKGDVTYDIGYFRCSYSSISRSANKYTVKCLYCGETHTSVYTHKSTGVSHAWCTRCNWETTNAGFHFNSETYAIAYSHGISANVEYGEDVNFEHCRKAKYALNCGVSDPDGIAVNSKSIDFN